jgi:hypothetical protein
MVRKFLPFAALAVLGAGAGCQGSIGDAAGSGPRAPGATGPGGQQQPGASGPGGSGPGASNPGPGGITPPGATPGGGAPADPTAAGPMPLLRLSRREYNNTVRDLLGDLSNQANAFSSDRESEFLFRRGGLVAIQDLDDLKDAAATIAAGVEAKVPTLAPCPMGTAEDACASKFVSTFGLRAYRRPLAAEENERLMALYQAGRTTLSLTYAGAIRLLVEAMLQAPPFLYHWELGSSAPVVEGKVVKLGPYEVASRLSYFVWGSMPDQALFEAAAAGKLGTQAEVEAQARRLLEDKRGRDTVSAFAEEWMNLDQVAERPKDPMVYPEFKDDLKAAMTEELRTFIASVVFDGDKSLSSLLTATSSFLNQPLAALYGVRNVTGTALKPAMLDAEQRAGLLTRAGFLTVTGATDGSHPVKRGRRVYERMLCGELPPPPPVVPPAKPASMGGTTRQRFEEHDMNPCAGACHEVMDKLGFAFEEYDGIGKFRTTDNGGKVDASGAIELDGSKQAFANARDLSQILAKSPTVASCFARQWMRFAFKRGDTAADAASLEAVEAAFAKGNAITDLLVGVAGSRSFRYRTPGNGEKLQ